MEYTFYMPETVQEALELLAKERGPLKVLAGGTDLMLDLRSNKCKPKGLVDLSGVHELKNTEVVDGVVNIGSTVTFAEVANSQFLKNRVSMLAEAASAVGSPQIRNQGTIGGNIANASPAADIVPPLVALDAVITVASLRGTKELPITAILAGVGKTNLASDEIITRIKFPLPKEYTKSTFVKFGRRNALAIARMSIAAFIDCSHGFINQARVALGAVAPNPFRATELEELLIGKPFGSELMEEVIALSSEVVSAKLGDRPSAKWKNHAVRGLMRQALEKLH